VQPQRLEDDALQVGQRGALGGGDAGGRDAARGNARVNLALQRAVGPRRAEEEEQARADGGRRGVGAGDDLQEGLGLTLALGEAVPDEGALVCSLLVTDLTVLSDLRTIMSCWSLASGPNRFPTISLAMLADLCQFKRRSTG
jgi:hypothetical protein